MNAYRFEQLDGVTREWMAQEFRAEEATGRPYRSTLLTDFGLHAFPMLMAEAISEGNERTLAEALSEEKYWKVTERMKRQVAVERLATNEFNTWYVRGLARRLIEEGEVHCQVYRAASAETSSTRPECVAHENAIVEVRVVYSGHRAKYWPPERANRRAFSVPTDANCHHSIRRTVEEPRPG